MNRPKILIIDDDPDFREALCAVVAGAGYQALTATDVESAAPILSRPDHGIALLIVDLVLPGDSSGLDLIGTVTRTPPAYKILATSGVYRGDILEYVARRIGADAFLEKQQRLDAVNAAEWLRTIAALIGAPGAGASGAAAPR